MIFLLVVAASVLALPPHHWLDRWVALAAVVAAGVIKIREDLD